MSTRIRMPDAAKDVEFDEDTAAAITILKLATSTAVLITR